MPTKNQTKEDQLEEVEERAYHWHDRLLVVPLLLTAVAIFSLGIVTNNKSDAVGIAANARGTGYAVVFDDGAVKRYGAIKSDPVFGDRIPASDITNVVSRSRGGAWAISSTGAVYSIGGAPYQGGLDGSIPPYPIIDLVPTPNENGYRLIGADGGVFDFNANTLTDGSLPDTGVAGDLLPDPIVAGASSSSGDGYWLVTSAGKVFAFGDAAFSGDLTQNGNEIGEARIVDVWAQPNSNRDYVLTSSDGRTFSFPGGDSIPCLAPSTTIASDSVNALTTQKNGDDCWFVSKDGSVTTAGSAQLLAPSEN